MFDNVGHRFTVSIDAGHNRSVLPLLPRPVTPSWIPVAHIYFHYDSFGRLCYYVSTSSSNACSSPPSGATSFSYDADGNRTSMVSGGTTTSYAYNAADELCASSTSGSASCSNPNYSWDADGNMTSSPTITSLVYNAKNQNTSRTFSGSTATFSYADADQTERVTQGNVSEATSPLGLSEESTPSSGTYHLLRDNQGNPIGEYHAGTFYFLTDGLGTITNVLSGSNGTVTKTFQYDPFGNVTELGNGTTTDLRYAGGIWDKATSNPGAGPLYHTGTRYYDPTTGRWTQQDALAGAISDPSSSDRYVYVGDDPMDFADPSATFGIGDITSFFVRNAVRIATDARYIEFAKDVGVGGASIDCAVGLIDTTTALVHKRFRAAGVSALEGAPGCITLAAVIAAG